MKIIKCPVKEKFIEKYCYNRSFECNKCKTKITLDGDDYENVSYFSNSLCSSFPSIPSEIVENDPNLIYSYEVKSVRCPFCGKWIPIGHIKKYESSAVGKTIVEEIVLGDELNVISST